MSAFFPRIQESERSGVPLSNNLQISENYAGIVSSTWHRLWRNWSLYTWRNQVFSGEILTTKKLVPLFMTFVVPHAFLFKQIQGTEAFTGKKKSFFGMKKPTAGRPLPSYPCLLEVSRVQQRHHPNPGPSSTEMERKTRKPRCISPSQAPNILFSEDLLFLSSG